MSRQETIGIRVRPDLKEKLQELAAADGRTLSNYIEIVLTQHVEAQPKKRRK